MASNLRTIERNRKNAQSSTGPKTPEGKRVVSQNARRLGLFISDSTLEIEEPAEFAEILAGYVTEYVPRTASEIELVRQLTVATHRLRRLERIETAALFTEEIAHTRHEAGLILKERFKLLCDTGDRIERVRVRTERTFNRVYQQLEARKARRIEPRQAPEQIEIEADTRHNTAESGFLLNARRRALTAAGSTDLPNKANVSAPAQPQPPVLDPPVPGRDPTRV